MLIWYQLLQNPRSVRPTDSQQGSLLGPSFGESEVIDLLQQKGAKYTVYDSDEALCEQVASLLDDQQVVGWFQGRMEFGPRALGARSILADARSPTMQSTMNLKIKFRESFRPFAPAVLKAHASELFEMEPDEESPYMLLVAPVRESIRKKSPTEFEKAVGPNRTNLERSTLPAITHVDDSARVQTVDDERNPMFHRLLSCFHERTGCPVLINSSFNVRGEPIVCTPEDAFRCFQLTDIDVLAIGRVVLLKKEQPEVTDEEKVQYRNQFQLD
jgi:carbamoyltransferase